MPLFFDDFRRSFWCILLLDVRVRWLVLGHGGDQSGCTSALVMSQVAYSTTMYQFPVLSYTGLVAQLVRPFFFLIIKLEEIRMGMVYVKGAYNR
jgi:hypothetical protein